MFCEFLPINISLVGGRSGERMKIQNYQVALSGSQKNELVSGRLHGFRVDVVSGSQTGGGSGISSDTRQAGIRLSLSQTVEETQQVATASSVKTLTGEEIGSFAAHYVARELSTYEKESELNVMATNVRLNSGTAGGTNFLGVAVEVHSILETERQENLTIEALGSITTEDGRQIDFMMALDFTRETHSKQSNVFTGSRDLIDPLMLNLKGDAVQLSDRTFEFDLDADGQLDEISEAASGSGYLVFDKNKNGIIDDGSEMFGPQSGQGFADLAQYDEDGNGWIDENDSVFSQLQIMTFSDDDSDAEDRMRLQSLSEAGVGAMFLGSVASDYDLHNDDGELQGTIKQSGVALSESGKTLLLQEVHLNNFSAEDGSVSEGAVSDVAEMEGISAGSDALRFFQFDDAVLNGRNENTQVRISVAGASDEQVSGNSLSSIQTGLTTHERRQTLRDWVASSMENYVAPEKNTSSAAAGNPMTDNPASERKTDRLADYINLDEETVDARLSEMRSMIESLRAMREQMKTQQEGLSVYLDVERL